MKKQKYFHTNIFKLFLGIAFGLTFCIVATYASSIIFEDGKNVSYDNTKTNLKDSNNNDVVDVQTALDELYLQSNVVCKNSPFKLGDYIEMRPTTPVVYLDDEISGYNDSFTDSISGYQIYVKRLYPTEIELWRVISINSNCTVEAVSEYSTGFSVAFGGKKGYMNAVYYMNELAKEFANTKYTLDPNDPNTPDGAFREVGYNGQTQIITDASRLNDTSLATSSGPWYNLKSSYYPGVEENLGGGEYLMHVRDLMLMERAGVDIITVRSHDAGDLERNNDTTYTRYLMGDYWLASRVYDSSSTSSWSFGLRYITGERETESRGRSVQIVSFKSGNYTEYNVAKNLRPIITFKASVTPRSGNGTKTSHYKL